jgi:hypothetical protein
MAPTAQEKTEKMTSETMWKEEGKTSRKRAETSPPKKRELQPGYNRTGTWKSSLNRLAPKWTPKMEIDRRPKVEVNDFLHSELLSSYGLLHNYEQTAG